MTLKCWYWSCRKTLPPFPSGFLYLANNCWKSNWGATKPNCLCFQFQNIEQTTHLKSNFIRLRVIACVGGERSRDSKTTRHYEIVLWECSATASAVGQVSRGNFPPSSKVTNLCLVWKEECFLLCLNRTEKYSSIKWNFYTGTANIQYRCRCSKTRFILTNSLHVSYIDI